MQTSGKGEQHSRLVNELINDVFLTVVLPLVIVVAVFFLLRGGDTPMPNLPETLTDGALFAVFPELAFATLFVWALARRRLTACLVPMTIKLDFVVLMGVVLSSLWIVAMLYYSWTGMIVNYWVIGTQIMLLATGVMFNVMITSKDCRYLRGDFENQNVRPTKEESTRNCDP